MVSFLIPKNSITNETIMIMKKTLLLVACAMVSISAFAQKDSGFGFKGGLNYNQNGDLIASVGDVAEDIVSGSEGKVGYHLGVFYKAKFAKLYVRPEIIYTKTNSSYRVQNEDNTYGVSKIDVPVLVGLDLIGPLHIFAGPSFQAILKNDFENATIDDLESDYTIGLQIGVGVNLGKLGLDVRYERGLSENETRFVSDNITDVSGKIDNRPSQVIFALSLKL